MRMTAVAGLKPELGLTALLAARVAGARCFYVTVPRVDIMKSTALLVPESGRVSEDTPTLRTEIDDFGNDVFKLTVPELKGKKGLLGLKIRMPPGTPDRLYLVHLQ